MQNAKIYFFIDDLGFFFIFLLLFFNCFNHFLDVYEKSKGDFSNEVVPRRKIKDKNVDRKKRG